MLRFCRGWLALLVCVPLAAAAPAAAQSADSSGEADADVARQLFAEGLEFVEADDWANAEERFRRVLALRSSDVVTYNLASALVQLGRPVEAAHLLRSILRSSSADASTRDAAQQLLAQAEPQIGTLTIRVSGDTTDVRFAVDDRPLALAGHVHTLSVDPGEHTVTAHRGQTRLAFERVVIGGAAPLQGELSIALPARIEPQRALARTAAAPPPRAPLASPPVRPPPQRADRDEDASQVWWWVAGGAALAAAATTLAIVLASSAASDAAPVTGDTDPPLVRGRVR